MRKVGLSLLLTAMVAAPYAALSQESEAPNADDYVCALTGECAEEAAEPAATAQPNGTPRVSATRGFSLSRPTPTPTRPKATPTRTPRQTAATQRRPQNRPVAIQPGRADLRLAFGPGPSTLSAPAQAQIRTFPEALGLPQLANVRVRIEGRLKGKPLVKRRLPGRERACGSER